MSMKLYSKVAVSNIKKNARLYIPRILAEAGLLGCFYIMITLALDQKLAEAFGGAYLSVFMVIGAVIIGLLSLILILYVNSFLMKQRKHEYGLYNVLGMEKKHVIRVLFYESLYTSCISIVIGIIFGILFYKLSSLLICKLLKGAVVTGFYYINAGTIVLPVIAFMALDGLAYIINSFSIRLLKPVELLAGQHTGEREPKIKWALFVLGILCLGAGYAIAITVKSPLSAMGMFFAAVFLVIFGTYFLFVAGTIFILKCLRSNKKYYYNKNHMPAVSGLLFRMKRNAVGLASIAILATGVLVMISTTVSLYSGIEDSLKWQYPQEMYFNANEVNDDISAPIPAEKLEKIVRDVADEKGIEIKTVERQSNLYVSYIYRDEKLYDKTEITGGYKPEEMTGVLYITNDLYNFAQNREEASRRQKLDLAKDEIAFCRIATPAGGMFKKLPETLAVGGKEYKVKEYLERFPIEAGMGQLVNTIGIVVSDEEVLDEIYRAQKTAYGEYASEYDDRIAVSFADERAVSAVGDEFTGEITNRLRTEYPGEIEYLLDTKWDTAESFLGLYGNFLFLGILLGFVCMFSAVLIIYYKQISEGYEDRDRFQIMEKIGMEQREVRKTIGSQLIMQFFLPLITAGVHTAFAFPILSKLLKVLMLSNTGLFIICTVITFVVFAIAYGIIYMMTARTYYRIVH